MWKWVWEMAFRVAIIGYGGVAAVHAAQLADARDIVLAAVWEPNRERAAGFAAKFPGAHVAACLGEAMDRADAAIVASPSDLHFEQARDCLGRAIPTLVELPPCASEAEWTRLVETANEHRTLVRCAHTSRYLRPYVLIREAVHAGKLGTIQQVTYVRHHRLRERNWTDSALLHHAAHPVDLLIEWFGAATPVACLAIPDVLHAESASLLAELAGGASASVSVTYSSRLPHVRMLVVGAAHTVETDGFSYLRSDSEELIFRGNEQAEYERAIQEQDLEFLRACRGEPAGIGWKETLTLMKTMERFVGLAGRARSAII